MFSKYRAVGNKYKILFPLLLSNKFFRKKGFQPDVKFIILARSRTGSTMLINYLKKIPSAFVESELMRRKFLLPFWGKIPELVFGYHPKKYKIAGFKCFYYHPIDDWDSNRFIYDYLLSHPDIKVIHWQREDLFAVIISRYIAMKTGKWAKTDKEKEIESFTISESAFKYDLETSISQINKVKNLFLGHKNYLEITYEDVVHRNKLPLLFEFLGVDASGIRHNSQSKQKTDDKYSRIINIDELKKIYQNRISEIINNE